MSDFTPAVTKELLRLTKKHDFIVFEDRKLADIGNTVYLQYNGGIYRIADWANLVNAHIVPGPGIIEAVQRVIREKKDGLNRGLLILAQMSTIGTLATGEYTRKAVEMANAYGDTIAGYIGTGSEPAELRKLSGMAQPGHAILTPGVKVGAASDDLKQGYAPPEAAVAAGSDVIIVGRGIYEAREPLKEAEKYRSAGWSAYRKRTF
jgi:orotidine 5'-phosphate decarboxylase subfamily 1